MAAMYGGRPGWIRTERTHPVVLLVVLIPLVVAAVFLFTPWFYLLVPGRGRLDAIGTFVVAALIVAVDLATWALFQPLSVRVAPWGITVRRATTFVIRIPTERLEVRSSRLTSFGWVGYRGGLGFWLSPNQFEAAKRYFPVVDRRSR